MITDYNRALMFAHSAHEGQTRKYTGEPYIEHPKSVVQILQSVGLKDESVLCAAILHDVVEDCNVSIEELDKEFGAQVANMVGYLTDPEVSGNRIVRKKASRIQLANAPGLVQSIKLADMIDNTASIQKNDPSFWKLYRVEKLMLLGAMHYGHPTLWTRAYRQCLEGIM